MKIICGIVISVKTMFKLLELSLLISCLNIFLFLLKDLNQETSYLLKKMMLKLIFLKMTLSLTMINFSYSELVIIMERLIKDTIFPV